jgi:hypothetical protein
LLMTNVLPYVPYRQWHCRLLLHSAPQT